MSLSTVGQSVFVLDAFARFSSDYHSFHTFPIPYPHSASHLVRIGFRSQSGYTFLGRVEGRLVRYSERQSMDQQVVTVDQFMAAMASIQEALASLRQEIGDQQAREAAEVSDGSTVWDDLEGMLVASLQAKFRMPDIERYTGIGCPRIHLRLYSTMMRAHGLDESQMITLFPLSLSGAAQRWFASLESSRRRTWDDLAQEFLRQFSFNTVVNVSRRELEALR
ncbi:hypothetical protein CK203_053449 [Vitis vinifera]|uniref:Retrotransposon gag domain-containing protein n=1 Tax=Vitis vinifera TaxID=29760 RepID=A0A438GZ28_VITVI|nr:hypothetical protein CK203_053449 [Vitis vinifera]